MTLGLTRFLTVPNGARWLAPRRWKATVRSVTCLLSLILLVPLPLAARVPSVVTLDRAWQIHSAAALGGAGREISSAGPADGAWQSAQVPTTVLGALVNNGVYTNVFFGTNLAAISKAPFAGPWWFRNEFRASPDECRANAELIFDGVNYRANVWLNGAPVALTNDLFGAFRIFHVDVSGRLKPGKNVLAVEVFPPQAGDFTMGFVDWNPKPPDLGMGLFRPVELHYYQAVAIHDVFVESKIDHAGWRKAALTVHADLENHSDRETAADLIGQIGGLAFHETFVLQPREKREVRLTPEKNESLNLANAQLWWPWELGEPHLYHLALSAMVEGRLSDRAETDFGIREVADYLTPEGYRGYEVNGKKILIRGGGWADELFLRESQTNLEAQIQYTKAMNLNTIRLEGIWGSSPRLYDLADRYGLLIMAGFSCQWEWSNLLGKKTDAFGGFTTEDDFRLATNYLHDQVVWLRNHPSIFVWVLGSDKLPRPELERRYDALLAGIDPTRPKLKTCGDDASKVSGPSGVKMNGPYDYVTPNYWFEDKKNGGAFGYNTETGPGPQPPPLETLQRMIPADHLWPIDAVWNFHCGRGEFGQMKRYLTAFDHRYGGAANVDEFAFKSQAANYEAIRSMYEAFAADLPHTTGVIQWMLNPSWPKLYWQLYDYYLVPGGAFFGAKRGAAPLAVIYNVADNAVYLVNQTRLDPGPTRTTARIYDLNSQLILEQSATNSGFDYGSQKVLALAGHEAGTPVYFLDLSAEDAAGKSLAQNFYWLSARADVLDEPHTSWYVTTNTAFADFTALNALRPARVRADLAYRLAAGAREATVTLKNPGDSLAFFIEMRLVGRHSQQSLTPVFWDDNYISLPPHSVKVFHARFPNGEKPELKLRGWNVEFVR